MSRQRFAFPLNDSADSSYTYAVTTSNSNGSASASASASTGISAPFFDTSVISGSEVDLSISTDYNATSMEILRDGSAISGGLESTFADTGLSPDSSHTYEIITSNSASSSTATQTVTTGPSTPTIAATTASNGVEIDLAFTADSTATTMQILRDGSSIYDSGVVSAFNDASLTSDSSHTYSVVVSNANGPSLSASTTAGTAPAAPMLSAAHAGSSEIDLTIGPDSLATSMQILRDGTEIYSSSTLIDAFADTGLAADSSHTYTVNTTNANGTSTATATTTTGPSKPVVTGAANGTGSEIDLTIAPDSAATTMQIYRNGTLIYSGGIITTFPDTGLPAQSSYTYKVTTNAPDGSSSSCITSGTGDPAAPEAPTVTAVAVSCDEIDLTIRPDPSATSMEIDRDGTQIYSGGPILALSDTGLASGTTYTYTVNTSNSGGSASASASATTEVPTITVSPGSVTNGIGTAQTLEVDVAGVFTGTIPITASGYDSTITVTQTSMTTTGTGESALYTVTGNAIGNTSINFAAGAAVPANVPAPVVPDRLYVDSSSIQLCTVVGNTSGDLIPDVGIRVRTGDPNNPIAPPPRTLTVSVQTDDGCVTIPATITTDNHGNAGVKIRPTPGRAGGLDGEAYVVTVSDPDGGGASGTIVVTFVQPDLAISSPTASAAAVRV